MGWLADKFESAANYLQNQAYANIAEANRIIEISKTYGITEGLKTLNDDFQEKVDNVDRAESLAAYSTRIYISVENKDGINSAAMNFQSIITGDIYGSSYDTNYSVDWNKDDSFNRAMNTIEQNAVNRMGSSPEFRELLTKSAWTLNDREKWEQKLSELVAEETDKIPAFSSYRSYFNQPGRPAEATVYSNNFNDFSHDIDHGTKNLEFDCDKMSFVKGAILQRLENKALPQSSPDGDYKKASNYFLYGLDTFDQSRGKNAHAVIASSATGNIIEGASDPSEGQPSYVKTGLDFVDLMEGKPFAVGGSVYGGLLTQRDVDVVSAVNIQKVLADVKQQTMDFKQQMEEYITDPRVQTSEQAKQTWKILKQGGRDTTEIDNLSHLFGNLDKDVAKTYGDIDKTYFNLMASWNAVASLTKDHPELASGISSEYKNSMMEIDPIVSNLHASRASYSDWEKGKIPTFADNCENLRKLIESTLANSANITKNISNDIKYSV